jgi:hypothetical protein
VMYLFCICDILIVFLEQGNKCKVSPPQQCVKLAARDNLCGNQFLFSIPANKSLYELNLALLSHHPLLILDEIIIKDLYQFF